MNYASRTHRLLGQMLDGLVGMAPLILASILSSLFDSLASVLFFAGGLWAIYYYLFADGFESGGSYGKRWLGMRVVARDGQAPCTFAQSFIRNLLLMILGPIDWFFILGERHQRLGDKAAGTVVLAD